MFFNSTNLQYAGWIVTDKGRKIWFSGLGDAGPCLLDMRTMSIVTSIRNPNFHHLAAVRSDGTVFLRQRRHIPEQGKWVHKGLPIVVYMPDCTAEE